MKNTIGQSCCNYESHHKKHKFMAPSNVLYVTEHPKHSFCESKQTTSQKLVFTLSHPPLKLSNCSLALQYPYIERF